MNADLDYYAGRPVSRETIADIDLYTAMLRDESARQNLISKSTIDRLWERHIADSAQLVRYEPFFGASWADVGSGAGLPGIVIACLVAGPVTLIEPRRLRAEFLTTVARALALEGRVRVLCSKAQNVHGLFDVITARAVSRLGALLALSHHLSHPGTVWVLPKGRNLQSELAEAQRSWHCDAAIEGSLTDPESEVLVLRSVRPKGRG